MAKALCMFAIFLASVWSLGSTETILEKVIEYSEKDSEKTCDLNEISAQSCDHVIGNNNAEPATVCLVSQSEQEEYVICIKGIWRPLGWVTDERQNHREKRFFFIAAIVAAAVVITTAAVVVCHYLCRRSGSGSGTVEQNYPPVITCPEIPKTFVCLPRETDTIVTWPDATAEDEEDRKQGKVPSVTQIRGNSSGSRFSHGDTIIYQAVDSYDVKASCVFSFKVSLITCLALDWPSNGKKRCDLPSDIYGTVCTFTCDPGYELHGDKTSDCQKDGTYTNPPPTCMRITCEQPQPPDNGEAVCTDSSYSFESSCYAKCNSGYSLETYFIIQCKADKTWSSALPKCKDSEPPLMQFCPNTINVYSDRGTDTAEVTWDDPIFTDNAGSVHINQTNGPPPGSIFSVGATKILYEARDDEGNLSPDCTFFVIVNTLTCQQNLKDDKLRYNCPDNNYNYGSTCELSCEGNYPLVGNSTITCERNKTVNSDETYWSFENETEPYCQEIICPPIDPPENGALTCDMAAANKFCILLCNAKYDFPMGTSVGEMYVCSNSLQWFPALPVPGCTVLRNPLYTTLPGDLYYFTGNCDDVATQNSIKEQFMQIFQSDKLTQVCPTSGCNITSVVVTCGPSGGRRKRSLQCNIDTKSGINECRHKRSTNTSHEIKLAYVLKMDSVKNVTDYYYIHNLMVDFENATIKQAIASGQLNFGNMSVSRSTTGWTDLTCAEGQKFRFQTFSCASCPTGTFFNKTADNCVKCPIGKYQDGDGSLDCKQCPDGTSTVKNGTTNSSLCLQICPEGSYSKTGLSPCFKCLQGQYQENNQSTSCEKCQHTQTTSTTGSTNHSDCTDFDILLKNSTIDLGITSAPNFTVSFWVFNRNANQVQTLDLTSVSQYVLHIIFSNTTSFVINGTATDVSAIVKQSRWIHVAIQVNTATGSLFVYLNGNSIFTNIITSIVGVKEMSLFLSDFLMSGYDVFSTILSEVDVLSLSKTCLSNLKSSNTIQSLDDLKGIPGAKLVIPSTCNVKYGCDDNPCNGHTCLDIANGFVCHCNNGYSGTTCNYPPDYCVNNNCNNGATCVGQNETYSCICKAGYKGSFCETAVVNGNWNSWQQWSECSKSCDIGIRSRNRSCDNPPPDDEGSYCVGNNTQTQSCNTDACQRCPSFLTMLNYGNTLKCNQMNGYDVCNVTCRTGLVFPNENYHVYHCGKNTSFEWQKKPPSCMEPNSPAIMAVRASSSITEFPCSRKDLAESTYKSNINTLWCRQNGNCKLEMSLDGCNYNNRRKRSSMSSINIYVTFSVDLENQPLNLVALFENGTVSPALTSYINAYNELETTAQQMNNLSSSIFEVTIDGVVYNVNNTINMEPRITCADGTVLQDGVCAQCPPGTKYLNGLCMYCDEGTYQNLTGQTDCVSCPYGFTTQFKGSTSILDCRVPMKTTSVKSIISTISEDDNKEDKKKSEETDNTVTIIASVIGGVIGINVIIILAIFIRRKIVIRKHMSSPTKVPSAASLRKIHPKIEVEPAEQDNKIEMNIDEEIEQKNHIILENNWLDKDFIPTSSNKLPPLQHKWQEKSDKIAT